MHEFEFMSFVRQVSSLLRPSVIFPRWKRCECVFLTGDSGFFFWEIISLITAAVTMPSI